MRTTAWLLVVPVLALGVGCGRGSSAAKAGVSDDLQKDLAAASSASLELANGSKAYQPTRFVSAIEQSETAVPIQRRPVKRPVVKNETAAETEQKAPDPAPQAVVDAPKAPEPEQPAVSSDVPTVPMVAPRPAPVPVEYPAAGGGSRGATGPANGPDMGGIIGVIIRGGGVGGDDHCVPRGRPRGGGFPGGRRFPIQSPPTLRPLIQR
jgi:hypothetical protein